MVSGTDDKPTINIIIIYKKLSGEIWRRAVEFYLLATLLAEIVLINDFNVFAEGSETFWCSNFIDCKNESWKTKFAFLKCVQLRA